MLLLTNAATMAVPQLFRIAVDDIKRGGTFGDLRRVALLLVAVAAAGAVFRTFSRIHILYAARDVELSLRCAFYSHLTKLEPGFFQRHPTGDLMSRPTNDLTQVRLMLGPGFLNIVNTFVAYATAIPLMVMISGKLTLVAFATYPPAMLLMRQMGKRMYQRNRKQQEALGSLSNFVQENLSGAQLVRAFAIEDEQTRRFEALNARYYDTNIDLAWTRSGMFRLSMSLASVAILCAVYFGAHDVLAGRLSVGDIVALVEYMALLSWPTFALGWVLSLWQRGLASMARIEEILSVAPQVTSGTLSPPEIAPDLHVRGLTVRYDERRALDDVSVELRAGQVLGIVGPIGSGKSTLVRALLRLVEVPAGAIVLGGHDILDLDLNRLRRMFAYVPQNPGLFSKTVAENVAFGAPEAPLDDVRAALTASVFDADLKALPQGLDTPVGERGITLSGGQKQRTALARALLLDPPLLLLDDALSAVDTETEAAILGHLQRLWKARSTVIVAHRISAVQHADSIIVLDKGKIVERGTHRELVQLGGLYASMAHRQELARAAALEEAEAAS